MFCWETYLNAKHRPRHKMNREEGGEKEEGKGDKIGGEEDKMNKGVQERGEKERE